MRCFGFIVFFYLTTFLFFAGCSVILDEDVTTSLQDIWYEDHFVITMSNIRAKKRQSGPMVETLLSIKYLHSKARIVLLLDRQNKRVILESFEAGQRRTEHLVLDSLTVNTPLKNLILVPHQIEPNPRIDVYVDCHYQGAIPLKRTFRQIADDNNDERVEAFRERRCQVSLYKSTSTNDALHHEQCSNLIIDPKTMLPKESNRESPNHENLANEPGFPSDYEENKSSSFYNIDQPATMKNYQEDRFDKKSDSSSLEFHHSSSRTTRFPNETEKSANVKRIPREERERGDQPPPDFGPICIEDAGLLKDLKSLVDINIKHLRELEIIKVELQHLRHLIENCAGCRQVVTTTMPTTTTTDRRISCDKFSPCYPGVSCRDTVHGPYCGACPRGYGGNGRVCIKSSVTTCMDRPCFQNVRCYDEIDGYRCGQCPSGYVGDGIRCDRQRGCSDQPCHPSVQCYPSNHPPYYMCGPCPEGFAGNGTLCEDLNECDLARPCYPGVRCFNLRPGFRCDSCPRGYSGSSHKGVGLEMARQHRQICEDINECEDGNNGGCGHAECINEIGGHRCGACKRGFSGNSTVGCRPAGNVCADWKTVCDVNADCVCLHATEYICRCRPGWGGNGELCGLDTDSDGIPDRRLSCPDSRCRADNCPTVPNTGQEDVDEDGQGDACDSDPDNDGVIGSSDNCPLVPNPEQKDTDQDGFDKVGDDCDNCPLHHNPKQEDADHDGVGDICDTDADNDGIFNDEDNCPYVANEDQRDSDDDGVGDVCDNCKNHSNPDQSDVDGDKTGDECDNDRDRDQDGIQDDRDNCPNIHNSEQNDDDRDGIGNACDSDIDGDGVPNVNDNCPWVVNRDQSDSNHDGIGNACQTDMDNDGYKNVDDNCPNNSLIWSTDFRKYETIALDPRGDAQIDPIWHIRNNGAEIFQSENSDPGIAIGPHSFNGVDFEGTFYIDDLEDDDSVGFVFSYQSNKRFYVLTWKKGYQPYWMLEPFRAIGEPGIVLRLVDSESGPGEMLRNSLWHNQDTPNQVKILWTEPRKFGWEAKTSYRWLLTHRPNIGLIRIRILRGDKLEADSGNIYDSTLKGGRLGVYCFSQEKITWSQLYYNCKESIPQDMYNELKPEFKKFVNMDGSRIALQRQNFSVHHSRRQMHRDDDLDFDVL